MTRWKSEVNRKRVKKCRPKCGKCHPPVMVKVLGRQSLLNRRKIDRQNNFLSGMKDGLNEGGRRTPMETNGYPELGQIDERIF